HLNIVNETGEAVPLSALKIRYWYTRESNQAQVYNCDWAVVGCANIKAQFVNLPSSRPGADSYVELSFTSGTLAAHGETGQIQSRIHKTNWTNYSQAGDYSFDPTKTQ